MRIDDFEFNLRELAGAMGDFGTLFPLAVGFIVVNGLNPAGLFTMIGLTNIVTGLIYHLPMPVEPKKVIAAVAISQRWTPARIYASGIGLGLTWFLLALTGWIDRLAKWTPKAVIRGIQLALGIQLFATGWGMVEEAWWLGILAVALAFLLRDNPRAPAALVLIGLGLVISAWQGRLLANLRFGLTWPPLLMPAWEEIWPAMVGAGFAQMPLTITNAVLATSALIADYFPDKPVPPRRLMLNMGVMNVVSPFFGGMPLCHGAGGLAGQYYFGARTGGANILEGLIEIGLGLFLGGSLAGLFASFPLAIIGGMMIVVALQLAKFGLDLRGVDLAVMLLVAGVSTWLNMAVGFAVGMAVYYAVEALKER
jgi:MFS superfamily sulfate permease-like transporter